MVYVDSKATRAGGSYSALEAVNRGDWEKRVIAAGKLAELQATERLCQELATRVLDLTGQTINTRSIHADTRASLATVAVGAVLFRLRNRELYLVRPCLTCGVGGFESRTIHDLTDLAYALSAWEVRCEGCSMDDEDWTHSW